MDDRGTQRTEIVTLRQWRRPAEGWRALNSAVIPTILVMLQFGVDSRPFRDSPEVQPPA
jgi:hypothetical protein